MPLTELDNSSESVWVKVFANKKSHFVASWYQPPVCRPDIGDLLVLENGNDKWVLVCYIIGMFCLILVDRCE